MDLIVDATLDETNANLKAIHDEFSNAEDYVGEDRDIWGQRDVEKAMSAFVDNWWVHRAKINKRLKGLSDQVDKACTAWSEADKGLAENLETESADA